MEEKKELLSRNLVERNLKKNKEVSSRKKLWV